MKELFKFVETEHHYDAYYYAPDGTQLIFISFEKSGIGRAAAFDIAKDVFESNY